MKPENMPVAPSFQTKEVTLAFPDSSPKGFVQVLNGLSLQLNPGEIVALVGESGSGKSTFAKVLTRMLPFDSGYVAINGEELPAGDLSRSPLEYRRKIQMIFQDPFGSLNPVHTVRHHLERPLLRHQQVSRPELEAKCIQLLEEVGLRPAESFLHRYPYALSGGQRQRVAIARALAVNPEILIADEPTSMLDVSIRLEVLSLLKQLRENRGLSILLITHDLESARYLADRVAVLYRGKVVEEGPARNLLSYPYHPYTKLLLESSPESSTAFTTPVPQPSLGPEAQLAPCTFASRCPEARSVCLRVPPKWLSPGNETRALCQPSEKDDERGYL